MSRPAPARHRGQTGFTLIELVLSLAIAALLVTTLTRIISNTLNTREDTRARNEVTRELRFAMDRMVTAVRRSDRLLLPLADNPNTNWREHIREQSVPPAPPEGDSTLATAVLAITLGPVVDHDEDGWADANNDKDFLDQNKNGSRDAGEPERIDEDPGADVNNDFASGVFGIDDDGDGSIDESNKEDDDEDQTANNDEDRFDGVDNDKDGAVDEDPGADMNGDGQSGVAGVDDDGDGATDESNKEDDDEDEDNSGTKDEDWLDTVVYFLDGQTLSERLPNLDPADGTDYTEYPIANNVTHFRVERVPDTGRRAVLVDITLEVTPPTGEPASVNTRVRVGGAL